MLFSSSFSPILCQSKNIILVSNLNENGKFNRNLFDQLTVNLNNDNDNTDALILWDPIRLASSAEMNRMEAALENLKVPYKILGLNNDFYQSKDFLSYDDDRALIGIKLLDPNLSTNALIRVESLNQLAGESDLNKINSVYVFTDKPLSNLQNSSSLLSLLNNKYIISFYFSENKFTAQFNSTTNIFEIGIPPSIQKDAVNYYVIEQKSDSVRIVKKNIQNDLEEILFTILTNEIIKPNVTLEKQNYDSSITKSLDIELKSSSKSKNLISDNRLYTLFDNGLIYLFDFSGKEKFVTELIGRTENNPALYKDLILTATFEGDLYSINSNNGEVLQVVGIGENITSDISLSEIDIQNQKIIGGLLGTINGNIFCYDAFTFEQLWKNDISKAPITSNPLVVNDKVIFINSNSSLYCVNSKSGSIIWKYEFADKQNFPINFSILSDGKNVFSISHDGNLLGIDLLLGKKNWSVNIKDMLDQFYISTDKEKLFLINKEGMMSIFSTKDGKEIGKIDFKKTNLFSFIITEMQDQSLIGFSDGSLNSFNSKFIERQLISPDQIPITSINIISKNEFSVKNYFGKITFYKIE